MEETPQKVKSAHWYKRILNRICLDERLSPNRRLLAVILGMQMDAQTDLDKKTYTAVLLGEFVNRAGIRLFDKDDIRPIEARTPIEKQAQDNINDVFKVILGADLEAQDAG